MDEEIRDEKLKYDINRVANNRTKQIIEKAKSAYSPLGKDLEKQTQKQVGALKSFNPSN